VSAQPRRSFGFLPETSTKRSFLETQQNRYYSSRNIPAGNAVLLVETIKSGSKEKLYELIKKGLVDINARYDNNETILHIAVKSDASPDIISLLIDAGADVHAKSRNGYTPLHDAARYDKVKAVKLLVAKGANPNTTTLDIAETGWFPSLSRLFGYSSSESSSSEAPKGKSPLYLAQEDDRPNEKTLEIIQFLESLTNKSLWFVVTPERALLRAVLSRQVAAVKRLLAEHRFSKSSLSEVLFNAVNRSEEKAEILVMLIDAGADVNAQGSLKRTPLHRAAYYGSLEAVKLLLSRGANPNALEHEGKSPLALAKEDTRPSKDTLAIIKILEPLTNKPKKQFGTSMSLEDELLLLRRAIKSNNVASVKQVLTEYTFSKDMLNTLLLDAAGESETKAEILAALINAGADVNTQNSLKRTPLHRAANYGNLAVAKLLLSRGANPNALDYEGRAPVYLAQEDDRPSKQTIAVIQLLEPVTKISLWFVVTPEVMLRRAVKENESQKVRSVLDMEEEPASKKEEATQHAQKHTKRFTVANKEELQKAWQQVSDKKSVYEILGLDKKSTEQEIDEAYKNWVRNHHPDLYRDEVLNKRANAILQYLNRYLRQ
jgi:ankyrin repeat protein